MDPLLRRMLGTRATREFDELEDAGHARTAVSPWSELDRADAMVHASGLDMAHCLACTEPGGDKRSDPIGDPYPNHDGAEGSARHLAGPNYVEDDLVGSLDRIGANPVEMDHGLLNVEKELEVLEDWI